MLRSGFQLLVSKMSTTKAAELCATCNFTLTDALQLATAVATQCDAFLTNDKQLKRVSEINILVVEELSI